MNKHIAVVGPTASGKTGLAIKIAKEFSGEIVSCDSMQLYKGMDIGTATPDENERSGITHHMMDILDIHSAYSVSDYVADAKEACDGIFSRGNIPVFCGGTGLYIDSYISGIQFGEYENDENIRNSLMNEALEKGSQVLYDRLSDIDPESAQKTHPENIKRVVRALEVYETTGVTLTEWNRRSKLNAQKKDCLVIGIDFSDRSMLYERIDKRVDIMMQNGLLQEAECLYNNGIKDSPTAGQAIGYKEFYPYFEGKTSLEECIETLKKNSRHYAKRQLTWFRRNSDIKWIIRSDEDENSLIEEAFGFVKDYLDKEYK